MGRNIELKARVTNPDAVEMRARALADQGPFELQQDDTFFACARGRLKLRQLGADEGQLIFYQRPDAAGPTLSEYVIAPTVTPAPLHAALAAALGTVGRVRKRRRLYIVGNTRIHLDDVAGLGSFLELEVVLAEGQSTAEGVATAHRLFEELGVPSSALVEGAYVDLLPPAE